MSGTARRESSDLNQLRKFGDRFDRDVLVVPRASLPVPVATTAWRRRLLCTGPDPAIEMFIRASRNKGSERVPH